MSSRRSGKIADISEDTGPTGVILGPQVHEDAENTVSDVVTSEDGVRPREEPPKILAISSRRAAGQLGQTRQATTSRLVKRLGGVLPEGGRRVSRPRCENDRRSEE